MPRVCPGLFFLAILYSSAFAIGRQATEAVGATGVNQQNAAPRVAPEEPRANHAPHTYYGPDGTSLLTVPERPVTPEQRKTDAVLRKQDELLRGLKESGAKFCSEYR